MHDAKRGLRRETGVFGLRRRGSAAAGEDVLVRAEAPRTGVLGERPAAADLGALAALAFARHENSLSRSIREVEIFALDFRRRGGGGGGGGRRLQKVAGPHGSCRCLALRVPAPQRLCVRASIVGATSFVTLGQQECSRAWRRRCRRRLQGLPNSLTGTDKTTRGSRMQPSGSVGSTPTLLAKK